MAHRGPPYADADYAGSGPGKIILYVGKECVERNIPTGPGRRAAYPAH